MNRPVWRSIVGFAVGLAAAWAVGTLLVYDQMRRHRRDLFHPHPLRRLAALGYLGRGPASVEGVFLLRDFVAWERFPLLRRRAQQLLRRMERDLDANPAPRLFEASA